MLSSLYNCIEVILIAIVIAINKYNNGWLIGSMGFFKIIDNDN